MKKLFSLLLFICSVLIVSAQNNLPPVYEIKSNTALINTLPNTYWQMLEDKDGKLSFEEVSKLPVTDKFHYDAAKFNELNISIHAYWFRYVLKNTMDHDAKIYLGDSDRFQNEQSDFYLIHSDGKLAHEINGFLTPWNKLSGLKEYRLISLELKPGEKIIIYRRIYNTYHFAFGPPSPSHHFFVGFGSTEKLMQKIYTSSQTQYFGAIHDIFIFGVLAFASLFIFLFFLIIHEKVYLYFSLYLFALAIGRFNTGTEMYDVFFRQFPLVYAYISYVIWFFPWFFLNLFIRQLLNAKYLFPRLNKFLKFFNILYALTYAVLLIISYADSFNNLLGDIITCEQIILALSFPVAFFLAVKVFKSNHILTYIVLPLQSIWSILWSAVIFCSTLSYEYNVKAFKYDSLRWLFENWYGLETILLSCLVVSFSWILLQRFGDLKKQIVQKELEKEIERRQLIEQQKIELEEQVTERTAELKQSLENLKSTQAQLIQSEKMASLGELTAGIAHEIQNPLNFVNNFSEVNHELIAEMKDEIDKGNYDEVKLLANDVEENEEKILQHGKRADAIVKGMLQHSRVSTGKKEPTDINALADEYLRLSYHGMRAKDKTFNATIKTDFDSSIGKINIVPQDIGRVLLNLFNNAFYAAPLPPKGGFKYSQNEHEPTVWVSTKKLGDRILISVRDNGPGIPKNIVDKIFQPFFTTKPTGQGTGLGLSLSYDIIKAHGGEIKVETREGEGAEFIIQLLL